MSEFNLIEEPWIPCIDRDGNRVEHGIRDTLAKAHELREICDDSPLVTVSIHRMLLALLYRAFEGPTDMEGWKAIWQAKSFDGNQHVDGYLERCKDRFWLFDAKNPFMQVAGLDMNKYKANNDLKEDRTVGVVRLAKEAPDEKGRILFNHRMGTERPAYESKLLARMLLATQSYAGTGTGGSTGKIGENQFTNVKASAAPCVDGLVLWLQGDNLFQTLMLNLVPREVCPSDLPAWEDDHIVQSAFNSWKMSVSFSGHVQRFAPLSRFVLLVDKASIFFTNGLKASSDANDPMKPYSRAEEKDEFRPVKLLESKAAWRDAHTLFCLESSVRKPPAALNHALLVVECFDETPLRANVVGMATDRDKALLWRHERMPVSIRILKSLDLYERLVTLLTEAEAVGADLSRGLCWNKSAKRTIRCEPVGRVQSIADLLISPSLEIRGKGTTLTAQGRAPDEAHNKAAMDLSDNIDPRPAYWARLERHFFDLLENLPNDWDSERDAWKPDRQQDATNTWRKRVKEEAKRALEESIRSLGSTARAIQAVARVRTDFNYDDPESARPEGSSGKDERRQEEQVTATQTKQGQELETRKKFIRYLLSLGGYEFRNGAGSLDEKRIDRGALADLRSGLGKEPVQMARVHKHVVPYVQAHGFNERWYYVLATLFGLFPKQRNRCSLGKAFKPLAFPEGEKKKDGMEARFVALLNAHPDDLDDHLRHAISLLKANEQPLDWFCLLEDLIEWGHPEGQVQLRWARDFYA